jgi:hypothetical protein
MPADSTKKSFQNPFKDRAPVMRFRAGQNVLITLLSFAFSVGATRLFLELTGYPQIGGGNLHIAHVLWGGLFLFAATLIAIIFVNEWMVTLAALVSGVGVGLFIDEVGKFITANNDYFFPSAAPIVYVMFLLTMLIASQVRMGRVKTNRAKMYEILERFAEVLDNDLSAYEREELLLSLTEVREKEANKDLAKLAAALEEYLITQKTKTDTIRPNFLDRLRLGWLTFERKKLPKHRLKIILIVGLFLYGAWTMISPVLFFSISKNPAELQTFLNQLISNNLIRNASGLNWFEAKVILEGGFGLIACIAAGLLLCKAEKVGVWTGILSLLTALTLVNLLVFYFEQFSTILMAIAQFILLVLLLRYKKRFQTGVTPIK